MAQRHVLVTGGTGFLGSRVCRALLSRGDKVTVVSRSPEKVRSSVDERCEAVSLSDLSSLHSEQAVDAVINFAGANIGGGWWTKARKAELLKSRIGLTTTLVDHFLSSSMKEEGSASVPPPPKVFLSASAVGFYEATTLPVEVAEDGLKGNGFASDLCAAWEESSKPIESLSTRLVTMRIGLVMGAGGGMLQNLTLPYKMCLGGTLGSGQQYMPWIHINDLVEAVLFLLDHDECKGPYNMVAPNAVTNYNFTKILGATLQRPTIMAAPGFALRLLLGEMSSLLLNGVNAVPKALLDSGFKFQFTDLSTALKDVYATK